MKTKTKERKEEILERMRIINSLLLASKACVAKGDGEKAVSKVIYASLSFKDVSRKILRNRSGSGEIMDAESIKNVKTNIDNAKKALDRKDWIGAERHIDYAMTYTEACNWQIFVMNGY